MTHAPPDAAHAQNPQSQLIELSAPHAVADALEFFRLVSALAKKFPRPQQLEHVAEDKITHRQRVGIGRVNDFDPAAATRGDVDIFQSHATATNDAKLWSMAQ